MGHECSPGSQRSPKDMCPVSRPPGLVKQVKLSQSVGPVPLLTRGVFLQRAAAAQREWMVQRFGGSTTRAHDINYSLYLIRRQSMKLATTATNVHAWRVRASPSGLKLTDLRYEHNTDGVAIWRGRNARRSTSDAWRLKLR